MVTLLRELHNEADVGVITYQRTKHTKMRILLVEDDENIRFFLKSMLEIQNYCVLEVGDGKEAVRLAECEHPDLILMDIGLPTIDGITATRHIRRNALLQAVPIIFLSGNHEAGIQALAFAAGGDEYLIKPFEFSKLENVLEKYLGRKKIMKNRYVLAEKGL